MFKFNLPWFSEWNKKNPTDIYGPAILVGAGVGAIATVAVIIGFGSPVPTDTVQTGPAGQGLYASNLSLSEEEIAKIPGVEDYYTDDPAVPEGGETLAKDAYENVQILGDLTEDNFNRLMAAMTLWVAPDQGCAYCHKGADDGEYADDDLYTKVVARRMIQMTQNINENWDGHVGETGVNCYSCHQGENVPSGIWFKIAPQLAVAKGWSANQNYATDQTGSTSLPHDALEKLLLEEGMIKVHDLEPRVPTEGTASIQDAERTYSLMNYFDNSLGVSCGFCHNSRAFYDPGQVTPQWATALMGIDMVRELNNEYLVPLKETYPENRLGPKHKDAPKAACLTCHKGYHKPLGGTSMISDWPELATTEAPEYEE